MGRGRPLKDHRPHPKVRPVAEGGEGATSAGGDMRPTELSADRSPSRPGAEKLGTYAVVPTRSWTFERRPSTRSETLSNRVLRSLRRVVVCFSKSRRRVFTSDRKSTRLNSSHITISY